MRRERQASNRFHLTFVDSVATMTCGDNVVMTTPAGPRLSRSIAMRRVVVTAALISVASCGDRRESVALVTEPASDASTTTAVVVASTTTPTLVPSTAHVDVETIDSDLGTVSFVLPDDVGPDPLPMPALPDFVVGYGKWFVDCCYLKIALQNVDPPMLDEERIGDFDANGVAWTVYDTGPRDGTMITVKATSGAITVLVGAQVRFPDKASEGEAQSVVEQVARSLVVSGPQSE